MTDNGNMKAAVENAQIIAAHLDDMLNGDTRPPNVGFALLFFPLGGDRKLVNYVGNCERRDMLIALKEVVARWEGQPEQRGTA